MAKAKPKERTATATDRAPAAAARAVSLTHDDIARRAYDLYVTRGGEHGHDVDDWVQAERELNVDSEC